MKLDWIKDPKIRAAVGSDLLLYGNAFVVENDDGTQQRRIRPDAVRIIMNKKRKVDCYEVDDGGCVSLYKPKHVWNGRLARAELAILSDENMVLVDRRELKKIEWASESERDMCGDTVSACPVCKMDWNDKGKHKDGCWLAALIKDLYVPPRYWKPKKGE